jgi:signal transduction histidine kinase
LKAEAMRLSIPFQLFARRLQPWWMSWSKSVTVVVALALTALIGMFDHNIGREIHISAFYLIPICLATWKAGRKSGLWLAFIGVVVWLAAEVTSGYPYAHWLIPYWNALMLLALYLVVVYLLAAFQAAHFHLEDTVQQRTAALQAEMAERRRLERAKLQAERLAVVGTMAAQVAHEVRNPLASITLNLDLVKKEINKLAQGREDLAGEGHTLVGEMREEILRIQRVLEEYLQFARLPKPQPHPVALNELLDQKLAFLNGEFEQAKVRLHTHFDPALKLVNVDAEQLWQALLNLIRNSLEAMPDGGELTIGTWQDGKQVRLRVIDTGKGMSEQQQQQVFTSFFTTKVRGTGLGLTLVQQIATEHGGDVECDSALGKGTTFTIVLPLQNSYDE